MAKDKRGMLLIGGQPVEDATKQLTILISPKDIKGSRSKNPDDCAAARAALHVKGCTAARVHLARTYLKMGKKWVRFFTPARLRSEIIAFDRGGTFSPGEYTLSPLPPSERESRGARYGGPDNGRKNKRAKKRLPYHLVTGVRPSVREYSR